MQNPNYSNVHNISNGWWHGITCADPFLRSKSWKLRECFISKIDDAWSLWWYPYTLLPPAEFHTINEQIFTLIRCARSKSLNRTFIEMFECDIYKMWNVVFRAKRRVFSRVPAQQTNTLQTKTCTYENIKFSGALSYCFLCENFSISYSFYPEYFSLVLAVLLKQMFWFIEKQNSHSLGHIENQKFIIIVYKKKDMLVFIR